MNTIINKLKQITPAAYIPVLLACITYFFHRNALNESWWIDDGIHLGFVSAYNPWQYLFHPDITGEFCFGLYVAPWNVIVYDINLWLFGLDAKWFHVHQLFSLWLTSVSTYFFLRLWISPSWAFFGAVAFLSGIPAVHIAHQLMTGHYLEGLLFVILAMLCYVWSIRKHKIYGALIGSAFYLLAVAAKEIFVPLVIFLPFLPEGTVRDKIRKLIPYVVVAIAYIPWRFAVLGALVPPAYAVQPEGLHINILNILAGIPVSLFGNDGWGVANLSICAFFAAIAAIRNQINGWLVLAGACALLAPLTPVILHATPLTSDRYLFLIWWAAACMIAFLWSARKSETWQWRYGLILTAVLLIFGNIQHSKMEEKKMNGYMVETFGQALKPAYTFILNSNESQFFIPPQAYATASTAVPAYYQLILNGIVEAEKRVNPAAPKRAVVIWQEEDLAKLDLAKVSIWQYNDQSGCIEDVTAAIADKVRQAQDKIIQRPLYIKAFYQQYALHWEVGPYQNGVYEIVFAEGDRIYSIPCDDLMLNHRFKRAKWSKEKNIPMYVRYTSPEGWITHSPWLSFSIEQGLFWEQ